MQIYWCIEKGPDKKECEDAACAGGKMLREGMGSMEASKPCAVYLMDGVGGYAGARDASTFTAQSLCDAKIPRDCESARFLIERIHDNIIVRGRHNPEHYYMSTTLTGIILAENISIMQYIGNTRLYSLRRGKLFQESHDQTTYQWLLDTDNALAAQYCNRNEIRGSLGYMREFIDLLETQEVFKDRVPALLLLTTDGVHEYLSREQMEKALFSDLSPEEKCQKLCREALLNGSHDDRSAILVRPTV